MCFDELRKNIESNYRESATFELGKVYLYLGNRKKAKDLFEELLIIGNEKRILHARFEIARLHRREGNRKKAEEMLQTLLPTSLKSYALIELAKIYSIQGNDEIARNIYTNLIKEEKNKQAIDQLLYLDIKNDNIEEIIELLKIFPKDHKYYSNIKGYILYRLGRIEEINSYNYFIKQLINYNEQNTIEHINKHLDENGYKKIHTIFSKNIDLTRLLEEIKEKIKNEEPNEYTIIEKYIITCDDYIGTIENEKVKQVEVITLPHSKKILTMYPIRIVNREEEKKLIYK